MFLLTRAADSIAATELCSVCGSGNQVVGETPGLSKHKECAWTLRAVGLRAETGGIVCSCGELSRC